MDFWEEFHCFFHRAHPNKTEGDMKEFKPISLVGSVLQGSSWLDEIGDR